MAFSHKNPATNQLWRREELFEALQLEQAKNKKSNPGTRRATNQQPGTQKKQQARSVNNNKTNRAWLA